MLEVEKLRENTDHAINMLEKRGIEAKSMINEALSSHESMLSIQRELQEKQTEMNALSRQIGDLFKIGKTDEANEIKSKTEALKTKLKELEEQYKTAGEAYQKLMVTIPNIPNELVPAGQSDADNEVVKTSNFDLNMLEHCTIPHWELGEKYGLFDLELGVKITGSGFPLYRGKGARLQRGLIRFFLDEAEKAGYEEFIPPLIVNANSAYGTGSLPDKDGQMYHCTEDDFYLIPTAEVPLTNIYRNEILSESDLPIKITGYTPCFRREAGSYGAHVRGLNRVHQFDKVEIVQFAHPDDSYKILDEMMTHVEMLLNKLELPYRVLRLCGGDLTFASAMTYDFEVYSAAQKRWLEVSSVSNFETFQSNRIKARVKDDDGKKRLIHTLNGSALALPRIVATLLENNQTAEGVKFPEVLHSYLGFSQLG